MDSRARRGTRALGLLAVAVAAGCTGATCAAGGPDGPAPVGGVLKPDFSGEEAKRERIGIVLVPVVTGFEQPTDLQVVPTDPKTLVVLQKTRAARWAALDGSAAGQLLEVKVRTAVEEGLLGLAFHHFRRHHEHLREMGRQTERRVSS
jgi:hypothetical protein